MLQEQQKKKKKSRKKKIPEQDRASQAFRVEFPLPLMGQSRASSLQALASCSLGVTAQLLIIHEAWGKSCTLTGYKTVIMKAFT